VKQGVGNNITKTLFHPNLVVVRLPTLCRCGYFCLSTLEVCKCHHLEYIVHHMLTMQESLKCSPQWHWHSIHFLKSIDSEDSDIQGVFKLRKLMNVPVNIGQLWYFINLSLATYKSPFEYSRVFCVSRGRSNAFSASYPQNAFSVHAYNVFV